MVAAATAPGGGRRNHPQQLKGGLSPSRRRLVELMQDINFGRLEHLAVVDGQPANDPPPTVIREVKFGGENDPRPERHAADFALKSQIIELFTVLDDFGDGLIDVLVIKHGLPFRLEIRQTAA